MKSRRERITELRTMLSECARPVRDPDLLRWMMDELMAILLNEESSEEVKIWILHESLNEDPNTYTCETPAEEDRWSETRLRNSMAKDD